MSRHTRSPEALQRRRGKRLSIRQRETITALRRAVEDLASFTSHRGSCEAFRGDRKPCTCGLAERLAAAQRLCIPNSPPADYTPRRYG